MKLSLAILASCAIFAYADRFLLQNEASVPAPAPAPENCPAPQSPGGEPLHHLKVMSTLSESCKSKPGFVCKVEAAYSKEFLDIQPIKSRLS